MCTVVGAGAVLQVPVKWNGEKTRRGKENTGDNGDTHASAPARNARVGLCPNDTKSTNPQAEDTSFIDSAVVDVVVVMVIDVSREDDAKR